MIGKKYKEEKKQVGAPEGNKNAQKQCAQNEHIDSKRTVEKIADQHKVSRETVKRAEKFAEAIDAIAETAGTRGCLSNGHPYEVGLADTMTNIISNEFVKGYCQCQYP